MNPTRLNKYHKGLIKNPHLCEVNLARSVSRNTAATFANLESGDTPSPLNHSHPRQPHRCVLWGASRDVYMPTDKELADLRLQGLDIDLLGLSSFRIAWILNVHFKSGQYRS